MANKSTSNKAPKASVASMENQPLMNQRGPIIQEYGSVRNLPLGLKPEVRQQSVERLNQVLADTITLASLYKKHHWQVSGATYYQLHLLYDKHYTEQDALIDAIAERIQLLGGVSTGMPASVAKLTKIENPPEGVEEVPVQISRLLEAHEHIMTQARQFAEEASDGGDAGTDDLLISQVLRTNELQTWFIASHLVDEHLVSVKGTQSN
jgi:starvation-inducible DNA-binding protein